MKRRSAIIGILAACAGCNADVAGTSNGFAEVTGDGGADSSGVPATDGGGSTSDAASSGAIDESEGGNDPKLDVESPDGGGPLDACKVQNDLSAPGDCEIQAPPDSFDPVLEWSFVTDPQTMLPLQSLVIPLVGNFTDDNGDGEIDLCDVPDVLLVAELFVGYPMPCSVYLLDGATGAMHWKIPQSAGVSCVGTPAFADIDGDGLPEIVATSYQGELLAFEHDGAPKWSMPGGDNAAHQFWQGAAVALHDLDADGDAEIVVGHAVFDHDGALVWEQPNPDPPEGEASTAADLDGDGRLEVVTGNAVYRHDGTPVFELGPTVTAKSMPQVANLDDDPLPEIALTSEQGLFLVEHDGTIAWGPVRPTNVPIENWATWLRPATIEDFDGDGDAEFASAARNTYAVYRGPTAADLLWQTEIVDVSGAAGGSAFDFLGDGVPEAMYADEWQLGVFDGETGETLLTQDRCSSTFVEYPVVADLDNDGSAEILVVSTICFDNAPPKPALQVFGEADARWIQARRIWNQHTYHVTNVREDGTLPVEPVDNWEVFNTFRTNAQIEGGGICIPPQG